MRRRDLLIALARSHAVGRWLPGPSAAMSAGFTVAEGDERGAAIGDRGINDNLTARRRVET